MLACVMPDRSQSRRPSSFSRKVAARNRLWLRMVEELKLTALQIAEHATIPLRTVQRGIKWAKANPETPGEAASDKERAEMARYIALRYGKLNDPSIKEFAASLAPRRRSL